MKFSASKRFAALCAMAVAAYAACGITPEDASKVYPVPPDKMDEFNARTGGLVEAPSNSKKVVIIDARREDESELENLAKAAETVISVMCEVRKANAAESFDAAKKAAFGAKADGAGAVILFCELQGESALSLWPEDAIAIVNLLPLRAEEYNAYRRRMVKEFWRSIAFTLGGYGNPAQLGTSVQPVFSIADLDATKGFGLTPMHVNSIKMNKSKLGLFGRRAVPYTRAIREGWAPPPTNDLQRAVWERLNSEKERGPAVQRPIKRQGQPPRPPRRAK